MTSLRVLLVEDDPFEREAVRRSLVHLGYQCDVAADGVEACAKHEADPADIVLTDWSMPGMTGLELCRALSAAEERRPYLVVVSGSDEHGRLLQALRAGADDFVAKPIDLDELDARLLAATRTVRAIRSLEASNASLARDGAEAFEAARSDAVTAVANRLRLDEDLARARADVVRHGRSMCVAMADVDHFKAYNDEYGHLAGDAALRRVAGAMRDALRTGDGVYRYGGEELVLLLAEASLDDGVRAMDRVRAAVEELWLPHRRALGARVTISAGVAKASADTPDGWLERADAALYAAKESGRNCVRGAVLRG